MTHNTPWLLSNSSPTANLTTRPVHTPGVGATYPILERILRSTLEGVVGWLVFEHRGAVLMIGGRRIMLVERIMLVDSKTCNDVLARGRITRNRSHS